ncbi:MAG: hypothetical protein N4A40_12950 [Tissierellales bacterium]|jgi:hypothetical protein|nr:hypothetical protein [Tissierellales bacterium]
MEEIIFYAHKDPSKQTLLNLIDNSKLGSTYRLSKYINEPMLRSTKKNGFDFRIAYEFTDQYSNKYYLKKEEAIFFSYFNTVVNAKPNVFSDGFIGIGEDLRKMKSVIVSPDIYLSYDEVIEIFGNLDKMKKLYH